MRPVGVAWVCPVGVAWVVTPSCCCWLGEVERGATFGRGDCLGWVRGAATGGGERKEGGGGDLD